MIYWSTALVVLTRKDMRNTQHCQQACCSSVRAKSDWIFVFIWRFRDRSEETSAPPCYKRQAGCKCHWPNKRDGKLSTALVVQTRKDICNTQHCQQACCSSVRAKSDCIVVFIWRFRDRSEETSAPPCYKRQADNSMKTLQGCKCHWPNKKEPENDLLIYCTTVVQTRKDMRNTQHCQQACCSSVRAKSDWIFVFIWRFRDRSEETSAPPCYTRQADNNMKTLQGCNKCHWPNKRNRKMIYWSTAQPLCRQEKILAQHSTLSTGLL